MILKKQYKHKLPVKRYQGSKCDVKYLTEALGLFPHQNDIVEMLSNIAYDMLLFDINNKQVNFNNIDEINGAILTVEVLPRFSYKKTSGEFWGVKDDYFVLKIFVSHYDKLSLSKNQLINKMASVITHELNHGYVFISKYYNSNTILEIPDFYEKCLKIYNSNEISSDVKDISYIFYLSYHIEIQAMVPQIYQELKSYFDTTKEEINIDNFKNAIKKCDIYWTFYSSIHEDIPKIRKYLLNTNNLHNVINVFKKYDIPLTEDILNKKIQECEKIFENALKDICCCAVAFFNDHKDTI